MPENTDNVDHRPTREFHVDFGRLQKIMHVGVRRAAGFMLLGSNAAENPEVGKAAFNAQNNEFRWRYFPELMSDDVVIDVQFNFKQWVIECGLRELDQHCAIFCDRIYEILVLVEFHGGQVPHAAANRIRTFVGRTSVAGKLQSISDEFGIEVGLGKYIHSLTLARNCLAHSLGRVTPRNSNSPDGLMLSWQVLNMYIGDIHLTDDLLPFNVEGEQAVHVRTEPKSRLVKFGELINLQPHELLEICWNYQLQTDLIAKATEEHLKARGISAPDPVKS